MQSIKKQVKSRVKQSKPSNEVQDFAIDNSLVSEEHYNDTQNVMWIQFLRNMSHHIIQTFVKSTKEKHQTKNKYHKIEIIAKQQRELKVQMNNSNSLMNMKSENGSKILNHSKLECKFDQAKHIREIKELNPDISCFQEVRNKPQQDSVKYKQQKRHNKVLRRRRYTDHITQSTFKFLELWLTTSCNDNQNIEYRNTKPILLLVQEHKQIYIYLIIGCKINKHYLIFIDIFKCLKQNQKPKGLTNQQNYCFFIILQFYRIISETIKIICSCQLLQIRIYQTSLQNDLRWNSKKYEIHLKTFIYYQNRMKRMQSSQQKTEIQAYAKGSSSPCFGRWHSIYRPRTYNLRRKRPNRICLEI